MFVRGCETAGVNVEINTKGTCLFEDRGTNDKLNAKEAIVGERDVTTASQKVYEGRCYFLCVWFGDCIVRDFPFMYKRTSSWSGI